MTIASMIAVFGTFATVFLAVCAVNMVLTDLFLTDRNDGHQREEIARRERERERARMKESARHIDAEGLGQIVHEAMNEIEPPPTPAEKLREFIEQSGWTMKPKQLLMLSFMCACGGMFALWLPTRSPLVGLLGAAVGMAIPFWLVSRARDKRLEKLRAQMPDALELMARVLRAGQTVSQAMNCVSEEFPPPLGTEFGYCHDQQNLGLSPDIAMRQLAKRTGAMEIKIFVMAMMVHRQAGGNITELFDRLAMLVRSRFKIRGDVQALTAEGRMQAMVLIGLPIAMWCVMFFINRPYALELFDHPWLLWSTLGMMGVGALCIRKIINFDF